MSCVINRIKRFLDVVVQSPTMLERMALRSHRSPRSDPSTPYPQRLCVRWLPSSWPARQVKVKPKPAETRDTTQAKKKKEKKAAVLGGSVECRRTPTHHRIVYAACG